MSQTFVFEELDTGTREYLTGVRDSQGAGAPGVFVPTTSAMAGCGCLGGIVVIAATLVLTLTTAVDVIYKEPTRVAFLQTAGLLLGGWLFFAGIRSKASGDKNTAGHWVYADSLHFYEAYREQVMVTKIDDIAEASYTHNYNNGAYQNSVVRVQLGDGSSVGATLNNEAKAEQLVVFLNYLAWARGPEGGERATMAPAQLGGLARYVSEHDHEPKDIDDKPDLSAIDLEFTEVPEEPTREGRAAPSFLPYVLLLIAGVVIFFAMKEMVNPPLRDDAIAEAVLTENCEPWFLQVYLLDERNTRHRDQVQRRLEREYDEAAGRVRTNPPVIEPNPLRDGMVQILQSLKSTVRPVVSLQVSEAGVKAGGEAEAKKRADKMRDDLVGKVEGQKHHTSDSKDPDFFTATGGIMGEMARLMPPVQPRDGIQFTIPRTARGIQLIEFASKPDDASHAHFEIEYQFVPNDRGTYGLRYKVEIRTNLDGAPVAIDSQDAEGNFRESDFDQELEKLRVKLLKGLIGQGNQQAGPGMGIVPQPGFQPVMPPPG